VDLPAARFFAASSRYTLVLPEPVMPWRRKDVFSLLLMWFRATVCSAVRGAPGNPWADFAVSVAGLRRVLVRPDGNMALQTLEGLEA